MYNVRTNNNQVVLWRKLHKAYIQYMFTKFSDVQLQKKKSMNCENTSFQKNTGQVACFGAKKRDKCLIKSLFESATRLDTHDQT